MNLKLLLVERFFLRSRELSYSKNAADLTELICKASERNEEQEQRKTEKLEDRPNLGFAD